MALARLVVRISLCDLRDLQLMLKSVRLVGLTESLSRALCEKYGFT